MNSAVSILALVSMFGCTFGAVGIGPAQIDPRQPDSCLDTATKQYYAIGDSWQLDACGISTCTRQNISGTPQLMVEYATCGAVMVDPPCYLNANATAAYPDCCPQPECPEDYSKEQNEKVDEFLTDIHAEGRLPGSNHKRIAHLKALQNQLLRTYPTLRRASSRFEFLLTT